MGKSKIKWRELPAIFYSHPYRNRVFVRSAARFKKQIFAAARLYRRTLISKTRLVALTGSFGKTSGMRALTVVLRGRIHPYSAFNAGIFLPWALLRVRPRDRHAVVETGIREPGQMEDIARMLRPDIVVATSVGSEHNRSFKTLERVREEKARLVQALPEKTGLAVLNGDDPHTLWMRTQTAARVITYGFGEENDVRAESFELDWPRGSRIAIRIGGERIEVSVRLLGRPAAYAVLAAMAVVHAEGLPLKEAAARLEELTAAEGRLQLIELPSGAYVLRDDFKGAMETVERAFEVVREIPAKRKIGILGRVEETVGLSGDVYRTLGALAAKSFGRLIFLSTKKDLSAFRAGAAKAGMPRGEMFHAADGPLSALDSLPDSLGPGDLILLKGRSTQRLERLGLALAGRRVRCLIPECATSYVRCARCKMLERGWGKHKVII